MYKVMIADDEPLMRKALCDLIDWHAYDCVLVYTASTGSALLENVKVCEPDIIITDIKMPNTDGIAVAKYIYETYPHIKVILLTGYADFSYAKAGITYNVVDYVTKTGALDGITVAIEKAKNLIKKEKAGQSLSDTELCTTFLKSVLDSSLHDSKKIESLARTYKISLNSYIVLYCVHSNDTDERVYVNIAHFFAMGFSQYVQYIIPLTKSRFCIIIDKVEQSIQNDLQIICTEIVTIIQNFMDSKIYIGVSEIFYSIQTLHEAWKQAQSAYEHSFFAETKTLHIYSKKKPIDMQSLFLEIEALTQEMYKHIKNGNTQSSGEILNRILRKQKENQLPIMSIKNFALTLENGYRTMLAEKNYTRPLQSFSDIIENILFFSEYEKILHSLTKEVSFIFCEHIQQGIDIVQEAMQYINTNFRKPITLDTIATYIGINNSYLSRVFKEKTNNTIMHTINMKKIEAAKELLLHSDIKTYKIAEEIGITNIQYFCRLFKKYTDISPSEYRKAHMAH